MMLTVFLLLMSEIVSFLHSINIQVILLFLNLQYKCYNKYKSVQHVDTPGVYFRWISLRLRIIVAGHPFDLYVPYTTYTNDSVTCLRQPIQGIYVFTKLNFFPQVFLRLAIYDVVVGHRQQLSYIIKWTICKVTEFSHRIIYN